MIRFTAEVCLWSKVNTDVGTQAVYFLLVLLTNSSSCQNMSYIHNMVGVFFLLYKVMNPIHWFGFSLFFFNFLINKMLLWCVTQTILLCVCMHMHITNILLDLDVSIFHLKEYSHEKCRRDTHNLLKISAISTMKSWVKLGKKPNAHPVQLFPHNPRGMQKKNRKKVERMVMSQDIYLHIYHCEKGNSIFILVRRRNLRKNYLLQGKINIKLLIFVVGNKKSNNKRISFLLFFPRLTFTPLSQTPHPKRCREMKWQITFST